MEETKADIEGSRANDTMSSALQLIGRSKLSLESGPERELTNSGSQNH
jgi:hypothetical protein